MWVAPHDDPLKIKSTHWGNSVYISYNADFDGDAMNIIISSGIAPRNELMRLSSVSNWLISHTTSSPSIGHVDDSIIGSAQLTRANVRLNKYHAMLLFQNTTVLPTFTDVGDSITGAECVSKLLADTPINFTRAPEWYKPALSAHMKYDPSEIKVKIDQGRLVSGILDKKSIGKGSNGGVYHIIANEYGPDRALDIMFNMQQLAHSYLLQYGYSIGIMDLIIHEEAKREIDAIASNLINKSKLITEELINGEIIPPIGKTVEEHVEDLQINNLSVFDDFTDTILKAIKPNVNNLLRLIMFGSKGKIDNMFNMMSAIGQKLINGERIRQKFGYKRTLPYFCRFDTSPEARGYITNSYLGGMTAAEYIFNAMAARFDLISKALSTSVTGEQNRKSIKNLESIIINNFRWATKDKIIIQFAYGGDFLDPRKVERVRFPTVLIADDAFATKYSHADYPAFYAAMEKDRAEYRRVFLTIERMNVKELMGDERRMPVDVERVINDILRDNQDSLAEPTTETLAAMVATVTALTEGIPYVLINEIQERNKTPVPEYIRAACQLLVMLIRSHLHPNALVAAKMTPGVLGLIIDKIRLRYSQALIDAGTAVGIIAAQSFSEPLTQYMLDAHHRSASGGTSKLTMIKAKEVLSARETSRLVNPTMLIPVAPEYRENKAKVQEIANNIEMMKFGRFVTDWQIFLEKFGEPVHSKWRHETALIKEFLKLNPLLSPPGDLVKWCIRFALNKTTLILKNMSMELIISKLRETFPDVFIVYTPENVKSIVIRVYMRSAMYKGAVDTDSVKAWKDLMIDTIIRGVDGVTNASVEPMLRNKINPDGSISRDTNVFGIVTSGTNLKGILYNKYVDKYNIHSDAIQEVYQMFGIEAARQKIISELRNLIPDINYRHYTIYANEMTRTGVVTRIDSSGMKDRGDNPFLRIGFSSPITTMEEVATNSSVGDITGVTPALLVGTVPQHGTLYNSFYVNKEFVQKNIKRPDDVLESLFE